MATKFDHARPWDFKNIVEQAVILAQYFPGLDFSRVVDVAVRSFWKKGHFVLPDGMDGLALIPKHSAVARLAKGNEEWPAYNRALVHLFEILKADCREFDFVDIIGVGPDVERCTRKTVEVYRRLEAIPGDVLVMAVQTGRLYKGKSAYDVCDLLKMKQEFGLDSFAVGCIVLTHPERMDKPEPHIDSVGSVHAPFPEAPFAEVTCLGRWPPFDRLIFNKHQRVSFSEGCGSATGVCSEVEF